jgi:SAM-dependent methyltransferase
MTSHLLKFYPEAQFGGFSDVDGTVAFYSRINSLLAPSSVVVDFGCGRGSGDSDSVPFRKHLRSFRGRVSQVIGLDVDVAGSDNQFVDEFRLLTCGVAWPVQDETVDLLYSDFVLEHLPEPGFFFTEAYRVLKPGGYLCLRTPNALGYVGLISVLLPGSLHKAILRQAQPDRRQADVFPTVYRCNTLWALRRELRTKGFKGVVYGYDAEPSYLGFSSVAYWLGTVYSKLAPPMLRSCLFAFAQKAGFGQDGAVAQNGVF